VGFLYPKYPTDVSDGDEQSFSPNKTTPSLLGTERGTDYTRRLETDADRNLLVAIDKDNSAASAVSSVLATGAVSGLIDSTLTTITTFVAPGETLITKVSCSGDAPADFTLLLNTVQIDIKRSSTADLDKEFSFSHPFKMLLNDVLDIKVFHHAPGKSRTFNTTIYGA
jgi:hypothetical protein